MSDAARYAEEAVELLLGGLTVDKWRWRKEEVPPLPGFDEPARVLETITEIKRTVYKKILTGLGWRLLGVDPKRARELDRPTVALTWLVATLARRYGVIHFLSRHEVEHLLDNELLDKRLLKSIDFELENLGASVGVMNYATHGALREMHRFETLAVPHFRLPQHAFNAAADGSIYINVSDVKSLLPKELLNEEKSLFDLHDFAHLACARLEPDLYGSRYFSSFGDVPARYRVLIRDARFRTVGARPFSDALLFSELSLGLFDEVQEETDESSVVDHVASGLAAYLLGRRSLLHPTSGAYLSVDRPIDPGELGILFQNKLYEATASELEEHLFVRGGRVGDPRDPLQGLGTVAFLERVSEEGLLYYERRNYLRHRAHKEALSLVASAILPSNWRRSPMSVQILRSVVDQAAKAAEPATEGLFSLSARHLNQAETELSQPRHQVLMPVKNVPRAFSLSQFEEAGLQTPESGYLELRRAFERLVRAPTCRADTHRIVREIAAHVLQAVLLVAGPNVLLVPILRGALPMWEAAAELFAHPPTQFLLGSKDKLTRATVVTQVGPVATPTPEQHVLVLDTVVARGDTVCGVLDHLGLPPSRVTVCSCYAAPEGLAAIAQRSVRTISGSVARSVDENGRLQPSTHGDIGAKLYEAVTQGAPR